MILMLTWQVLQESLRPGASLSPQAHLSCHAKDHRGTREQAEGRVGKGWRTWALPRQAHWVSPLQPAQHTPWKETSHLERAPKQVCDSCLALPAGDAHRVKIVRAKSPSGNFLESGGLCVPSSIRRKRGHA